MLAVEAEGDSLVHRLRGGHGRARVREVTDHSGLGIENGDGLLVLRLWSPVTSVDDRQITMIGRPRHVHWQTVELRKRSRHRFENLFAGRQINLLRRLARCYGRKNNGRAKQELEN